MRTVGIVTAFWGREEVTTKFIEHCAMLRTVLESHLVDLRLFAAFSPEDEDTPYVQFARDLGWELIKEPNKPLCEKFNKVAELARDSMEDACGIIATGADDFMSGSFILGLLDRHEETGAELIGAKDIYFYRRSTGEAFHWTGYVGAREGEPIGAGRFLATSLLDRWLWRPWPRIGDRGLDGAMWARADVVSAKVLCLSMRELGGTIIDVKDEANMTAWMSVRQNPDSVEISADDLEQLHGTLPFRPLILAGSGKWFDVPRDGDTSLVMVARARDEVELRELKHALFSVVGVCQSAIVLLDDSSVDGTRELLELHGCTTLEWTWQNDFAAARNKAMELHPRARWHVVLDADEELYRGELYQALRGAEAENADAVSVSVKIWTDSGVKHQPRSIRIYDPQASRDVVVFDEENDEERIETIPVHWQNAEHNQLVGISRIGHSPTSLIVTSYKGRMEDRAHRQLPGLIKTITAEGKAPEGESQSEREARIRRLAHAHRYAARAYMVLGEDAKAKVHAGFSVQLGPNDPINVPAWIMFASLHSKEGELGAAWQILLECLESGHYLFPDVWRHVIAFGMTALSHASNTPSMYDGLSRVAFAGLEGRIAECARILSLPLSLKEKA